MTQDTITKLANYLNIKFSHPRREYDNPRGVTIYTPRHIAEPTPTITHSTETYTNVNEAQIKTAASEYDTLFKSKSPRVSRKKFDEAFDKEIADMRTRHLLTNASIPLTAGVGGGLLVGTSHLNKGLTTAQKVKRLVLAGGIGTAAALGGTTLMNLGLRSMAKQVQEVPELNRSNRELEYHRYKTTKMHQGYFE